MRIAGITISTVVATMSALGGIGSAQAVSSSSAPSNWRLLPGMAFNGVSGALDGVARIRYDSSICSGSLLAGGRYVLTAAHCADNFASMTVDFGAVGGEATVTRTVAVGDVWLHPGWTGTDSTGADIAVVKLNAPVIGIRGFRLSTTNDVGKNILLAGYGTTGTGDSSVDPDWSEWGYAHYGYNTFEVTSKVFNDAWDGSGNNAFGETYVMDFDNGSANNNTLQRVAAHLGTKAWSSNLGLGSGEALIAGGDSGGGDFVWNGNEWLLSGVHSWTWEFCDTRISPNCDLHPGVRSSFGDISGSTAVFSSADWIRHVAFVPEPQVSALMLAGLAVLGGVARHRRRSAD